MYILFMFKQYYPKKHRRDLFETLHCNSGHLGSERIYKQARAGVYWPEMESDITHFIHKECPCLSRKAKHIQRQAPMKSISATKLIELISIDFLYLEPGQNIYNYILVVIDSFTRFAQAYPTKRQIHSCCRSQIV